MRPRDEFERQFAEDIDRLLRGEEPLSIETDADYAEALQFAQRLMSLREEPDEEFAGQLRHRLVVELAERDAKQEASGSWFVRVFSRPSLRLAVVSTFIVLAAVGLVWRSGMLSPMTPHTEEPGPGIMTTPDPSAPEDRAATDDPFLTMEDPAPEAAPAAALTVQGLVSETNLYAEPVSITIEFSNEGPEPVSLAFFPPAVQIRDAATGEIVYSFAAGDRGDSIQPLGIRSYTVRWPQEDQTGAQVDSGSYIVEVAVAETNADADKWPAEVMTVASFSIEHEDSGD